MPPDLAPILAAEKNHQWLLFAGLVIGAILAFAKQGWVSDFIARKLTAKSLPFYALLVSVLGTASTEIVQGKPWTQALMDSLFAAFAAIGAHQIVIESLRSGREIVPPTKTTAARRADCPPASSPPSIHAPPVTPIPPTPEDPSARQPQVRRPQVRRPQP